MAGLQPAAFYSRSLEQGQVILIHDITTSYE
jgi:hypothetical protein